MWSGTDGSVYVGASSITRHFKASLHASGRWHIAFSAEHMQSPSPLLARDRDRRVARFGPDAEIAPSFRRAFSVVIPERDLSDLKGTPRSSVHWLPAPPVGDLWEITCVLGERELPVATWPGKRAPGTQLLGALPLSGGRKVWVVAHPRTPSTLELAEWQVLRENIAVELARRQIAPRDDSGQVRAVGVFSHSDGSWFFVDFSAGAL